MQITSAARRRPEVEAGWERIYTCERWGGSEVTPAALRPWGGRSAGGWRLLAVLLGRRVLLGGLLVLRVLLGGLLLGGHRGVLGALVRRQREELLVGGRAIERLHGRDRDVLGEVELGQDGLEVVGDERLGIDDHRRHATGLVGDPLAGHRLQDERAA